MREFSMPDKRVPRAGRREANGNYRPSYRDDYTKDVRIARVLFIFSCCAVIGFGLGNLLADIFIR